MADCQKCIFPHLRGCPVMGKNCAACLNLYKDRSTCKASECPTCRWLKYCKEYGINLNDPNYKPKKCKVCGEPFGNNLHKRIQLIDATHHTITQKLNMINVCFSCFVKLTEEDSDDKES